MASTATDALHAAAHHAERAETALRAVSTTTPGILDLLIAVGYVIDAIRILATTQEG